MGIESPVHLLFIAVVALIVLGPKRLPQLARALGQGLREFRGSLEEGARTPEPTVAPAQPQESAPSQQSAPPPQPPASPRPVAQPPSAPPTPSSPGGEGSVDATPL